MQWEEAACICMRARILVHIIPTSEVSLVLLCDSNYILPGQQLEERFAEPTEDVPAEGWRRRECFGTLLGIRAVRPRHLEPDHAGVDVSRNIPASLGFCWHSSVKQTAWRESCSRRRPLARPQQGIA